MNKIKQPRSGSPICQSQVCLQTELDDTNSCYQLIVTITISEKKNLGQTSPVGTVSKAKNLEISQGFFFSSKVSGCCYGYRDQFCDWWIKLSGLSTIGCFNCPITGVRLQPTDQLQLFSDT